MPSGALMTRPLQPASPARMTELGREESLALPASVPRGRLGLSQQALPTIRLVNHLVDCGHIVIRTHTESALLRDPSLAEVVVYEADQIDLEARTGWSVMVTARPAWSPTPWTSPATSNCSRPGSTSTWTTCSRLRGAGGRVRRHAGVWWRLLKMSATASAPSSDPARSASRASSTLSRLVCPATPPPAPGAPHPRGPRARLPLLAVGHGRLCSPQCVLRSAGWYGNDHTAGPRSARGHLHGFHRRHPRPHQVRHSVRGRSDATLGAIRYARPPTVATPGAAHGDAQQLILPFGRMRVPFG
ncbi:pyridoxamine 5'-phosphate oxidase family protein [Streptomyces mirabilis]|uniref:pyridoxamine 5'-phosphate oxidase family protein n=1 Tax=Streptomyces mirabilis TaxID=68239 RepID=UPI00332670A4